MEENKRKEDGWMEWQERTKEGQTDGLLSLD